MTIVEHFRKCFIDTLIGTRFTRKQIIDILHGKYGTNEVTVISSDTCYNMTNNGLGESIKDVD